MKIAPSHLDALKALGYTDEESRFLYLVATHSGYFTARQFLAFSDAHWGKRTNNLWHKLESQKHARIERFPLSGPVYHLFSRKLYRQLERENIRNRRAHEITFIKRRLAILDFVMAHADCEFFETEPDKLKYFCGTLGISKNFLPSKLYVGRAGSRPTVRHFVDKFPMLLTTGNVSSVVTFTYFPEDELSLADFVRHLGEYSPLFRQLPDFRFLYVARNGVGFDKARELFDSLVRVPLEPNASDDLLRYFRVRLAWEEKQYSMLTDADLVFRNQARGRFRGGRFEAMYRGWRKGTIHAERICAEFAGTGHAHAIRFGPYQLKPALARDDEVAAEG
jgi:hypothetical protein